MSRLEFEGRIFDTNVVGPIQTRFNFNGTNTFEAVPPVPAVSYELVSSGIFHRENPEDLSPEFDTARRILKITAELSELGVRIRDGEFEDRADNFGYTGIRVQALKDQISSIVAARSQREVPSPRADFLEVLRDTPLINSIVNKAPRPGDGKMLV